MSFIFQDNGDLSGLSIEEFAEVYKKKEDREMWYKATIEAIQKKKEEITYQQRVFLAAYRGFYLERGNLGSNYLPYSNRIGSNRSGRFKKFVINHIHDITETKISQRAKLRPEVEVLPVHDEFSDKGAAKVTKVLVKNIFETNNFDDKMEKLDRYSEIMGEAYMVTTFDDAKGPMHPVYKKAKEEGLKKIVLDDGTEVTLDRAVNVGEVNVDVEIPWRILLQPKSNFDEVEYCFRIHLMPIKRVASKFNVDSEILKGGTDGYSYFNPETLQSEFLEEHIPVYEFWHKHTEDLVNGMHCYVTANGVELLQEDLLSSDGELPVTRLTSEDYPEELHGVSRYEYALPIQRMIDNLNTLISRNIYLSGQSKWMIQEGSVTKKEQLGNDNTILEFLGPIAPQQITTQPNPPEVYSYLANLENKLQMIMGGVTDQARGTEGAKYTSSVAMQYVNELEMNRASTAMAKRARFITQQARKVIVCAKDNYQMEDERMIRLVGKNNSYLIRQFDVSVLDKAYDVRFENSSGQPESKAAKMERAQILVSQYPKALTPERWMQVLELGDIEKANNLKTAAVTSADAIVERLQSGEPVSQPEEFENHLVHWEAVASLFQSISFKEESSNEIFLTAKEHMIIREKLMLEKSKSNPNFAAELARFPMFPLFFHEEYAPPASAEQQQAIVQGQANQGLPVTGSIPGQPINNEGEES